VGKRPRHPDKTLEALLQEVERYGWRVDKKAKYFKALCPCADRCMETVHLTPSDPNYPRNKRNKMSKCTGWGAKP
jgi:hypothetical protein